MSKMSLFCFVGKDSITCMPLIKTIYFRKNQNLFTILSLHSFVDFVKFDLLATDIFWTTNFVR